MGIIRPRILLTAALDGRATFLIAGAVLGVGVYGFATTFKPYDSGRVLQPFPAIEPAVMTIDGPTPEIPEGILPDASTSRAIPAPGAPGEALVSVPRTAPTEPSRSSVAAAGLSPSVPLEPVAEPEATTAPDDVLPFLHPGYDRGRERDDNVRRTVRSVTSRIRPD